MSDQGGPDAGGVIAGIFIILFGLCLTLLGGGCTVMFLSEVGSSPYGSGGMWLLFLLSVIVLGAGIALIWLGIKLMTGGFRK